MNQRPNIDERLRSLLGARSMTQEELATKIGRQPRTVSNWLSGGTQPRAEDIVLLADAFGVSADFLLGRVDGENGLVPDMWIVDEDKVARAMREPGPAPAVAWKVPRRSRIVTIEEATRIEQAIREARKHGGLEA
jgi:transcriptional regulator with XRE-family HTH domain